MEKDYIQNFKAEIIKDINHQDSNVPQEVREYRKAFISRKCNNENLREIIKATEKIKQFDKNAFFAQWDNLLEEVVRG